MSYRPSFEPMQAKRRGYGTLLVSLLALLLIAIGLLFVFLWVTGASPSLALFASPTPTPTETPTLPPPSETPTITLTPTVADTPTPESSPTASAPFLYLVQAGDTLTSIAEAHGVDVIVIMALNGLSNEDFLFIGQELIVPDPNTGLPSPTPIPNLPAGSLIDYLVLPGDTLASIAEEFLSTEDALIEANELENPNQLFVGQLLKVPIRLITPTFGPPPTETPSAEETQAPAASETPSS